MAWDDNVRISAPKQAVVQEEMVAGVCFERGLDQAQCMPPKLCQWAAAAFDPFSASRFLKHSQILVFSGSC